MTIFWLLFLWPALAVLSPFRLTLGGQRFAWFSVAVIFSLIVGLRHEVGGDWQTYLPIFHDTSGLTFVEAISKSDPGYFALNWLVAQLGGSIYWVNLFCALLLMWGTVIFCRRQPNPWLALLVSVPYMLIVVGMGYTRQSVALGFALIGLVALAEQRVRWFVAWVVLGALFHKSAVLLLPIAALAVTQNRILIATIIGATTALMYYLLLQSSSDALWTNYVGADLQSQGGAVRVAMNAVPAILLFLFRTRLLLEKKERNLWLWMSAFALACIPLVGLASTAIDRLALYLIPLQLFVFARLPRLAGSTASRTALVISLVAYYAAVEFVWLNYATHSQYWVPYHFMPL